MNKNLSYFIIIFSAIKIIDNNQNIDYTFETKNYKIIKKFNNDKTGLIIYSTDSQYSNKLGSFFDLDIFYPILTSGHQILLYIKLILEYSKKINLTKEEIIIDNKIFLYSKLYSKNNKKLIILNPGIGYFSFQDDYQSVYYIDDLFKSGFNIIIFHRDYFNIDRSLLFYDPFDISFYLDKFILNIMSTKDYKTNDLYLLGLSGGCYTVLKYLSNNDFKKPEQFKSSILISGSPNIEGNILKMNKLIALRINYSIVTAINSYKNNYNINKFDSLHKTIGQLGVSNYNFKTVSEYYNSLNKINNNLNQIKYPILFLNSEDDNIAHIEYVNEYLEKYFDNDNFNFIITKYGWHGVFYNSRKDFITKIVQYFFD